MSQLHSTATTPPEASLRLRRGGSNGWSIYRLSLISQTFGVVAESRECGASGPRVLEVSTVAVIASFTVLDSLAALESNKARAHHAGLADFVWLQTRSVLRAASCRLVRRSCRSSSFGAPPCSWKIEMYVAR